jgi:hypothetical protein
MPRENSFSDDLAEDVSGVRAFDLRDPASPGFAVKASVDSVQADALLSAWTPMKGFVRGSMSSSLDLAGDGTRPEQLQRSLTAIGLALLLNGQVGPGPVLEAIAAATRLPSLREAKFQDLKVPFQVERGRVAMRDAELHTTSGDWKFSGSVGFDGSLDYAVSITVPAEQVARAEYTIRLKKGIVYQDHPCFAKDAEGKPLYRNLTAADVRHFDTPNDFPQKGTRELVAEDYVRAIRRLADPRVACPVISTLERHILGLEMAGTEIARLLAEERAKRKAGAGMAYSQEQDENVKPIRLDYLKLDCEGVQLVDRYTFRVTLCRKYPEILNWMAMSFLWANSWNSLPRWATLSGW